MSLEGKTCVVTGGSQGIGKCTAAGLARLGAHVVLVSLDPGRAEKARAEITAATGNDRVECLQADLSSLASVRELAQTLRGREGALAVLVNNAAVASPDRRETVDGLERQLAVNHLAPFLLTNLLRDRLVADAPARVVNVSSWIHEKGEIDFDDLQGQRDYTGVRAYNQSKLANVLFTYELARRLRDTGVTANCLHPGVAPTGLNNFFRPVPGAAVAGDPGRGSGSGGAAPLMTRALRGVRRRMNSLLGRSRPPTPELASRTSVYLASSTEIDGITGKYFVDSRQAPSSPATHDEELAARLWEVSERLTGLRA
jgi:NAD(P)-dependent dehydrogenase (short-subunit alcohol dehydrogenase family)